MSRRAEVERLRDILEHIDQVREAERVVDGYEDDPRLGQVAFNAMLYAIIVIGEAVSHLPAEVREAFPGVRWQHIVGMRNVLAHEYFRVAPTLVHAVLDADLRELEAAAADLLNRPSGA